MNDNSKAMDVIVNKVIKSISETLNKQPYDKTFTSVVYGKTEDGKYQIPYEGRLRNVQNALPCDLKNGQTVWVKIPNGKLREMHICGLKNK